MLSDDGKDHLMIGSVAERHARHESLFHPHVHDASGTPTTPSFRAHDSRLQWRVLQIPIEPMTHQPDVHCLFLRHDLWVREEGGSSRYPMQDERMTAKRPVGEIAVCQLARSLTP